MLSSFLCYSEDTTLFGQPNHICHLQSESFASSHDEARIIAGVGVVFISPQNHVLPRAFSLTKSCSNNVAEYNALLIGLQIAHGMGVRYLEAYSDSKLIINQVKGEYEVRHEDLVPYYTRLLNWLIYLMAFTSGAYLDLRILRWMLLLH